MIKLDIVNAVVATTNISRTKAEQAVETVFESLKQALGRGQRIELRRFGVFSVKPRKTGIGRNPRTGEEVNIPSNPAKSFRASNKKKRRSNPLQQILRRCKSYESISVSLWRETVKL